MLEMPDFIFNVYSLVPKMALVSLDFPSFETTLQHFLCLSLLSSSRFKNPGSRSCSLAETDTSRPRLPNIC